VSEADAVFVETAARLHFGVLDLRGRGGRWFGGIGAAAPGPSVLVSARSAPALEVTGADADRAIEFASRYLAGHGPQLGARVHVHRALPRHSGLGSGTQLALAVARALAELHGLPTDVRRLARAAGRARRSAVGTWTFAGGGLVVEGGRRRDDEGCGPLIARVPFPRSWRCIVAVPGGAPPGVTGADEEAAFAALPPPPEREVEHVAHLVLLSLLPALADADLAGFGDALTRIQETTGRWFASVQGGAFARGPSAEVVRLMAACGAAGVGQSSWGPAVYGIVDGEDAGARLADQIRERLRGDGAVFAGPFRDEGARVWRAASVEEEGQGAG
jgi:beta-RFAP synthase